MARTGVRATGYQQFCGLARALDVVGDRWTLLIVRELLVTTRRHSELKAALPGIASNLLSDRLHQLVTEGIAERDERPGRKAVTYRLTERGQQLRGSVLELVRWGSQFMSSGPRPGDSVQPQWLALALDAMLSSRDFPHEGSITIYPADTAGAASETGAATEPFHLRVRRHGAAVDMGASTSGANSESHATAHESSILAPTAVILGLFAGALNPRSPAAQSALIVDPDGLIAQTLAALTIE